MKNILSLNNISKFFGDTEVLKDINLDVQKGKIISLLGQSGSGKTTLLNIIAGFQKANNGTLTLNNKILVDKNRFVEPNKREIGFVFQNYALFPHMTVFENISFAIDNLSKNKQKEIVSKLLKLVHLENYEKSYPHELSGGQQQRVALIRTLSTNPELILLDEPFSGIDTMLKTTIIKELLEILKATHKTAIIVTHDPLEAMAMSDKIIYLEDGKIMQYDTPSNIYNNPKTKKIATSFGIANFIKKDDIKYCVRPHNCVLSSTGEFKVKVLSKIYQGDKYILEVSFDDNILMVYSYDLVKDEDLYITIFWEKCIKIDE